METVNDEEFFAAVPLFSAFEGVTDTILGAARVLLRCPSGD